MIKVLQSGAEVHFNSNKGGFCEHCYKLNKFEPSIVIDGVEWCLNCGEYMTIITEEERKEIEGIMDKLEIIYIKERLQELNEDVVVISKAEYVGLQLDAAKLSCLESGGVDNWCGYSESLCYMKEYYPQFYDEGEDACILSVDEILEKQKAKKLLESLE